MWRVGLFGLALLSLAGCEEGKGPAFLQAPASEAADSPAATRTRLVERDIEAPEVFQVSEPGLWDGRPSLGGVWVAHPDVKDPERVLIRNTANGKFVIGALFRRERELPGPRLQVSSDAAAALDILAGAPAKLQVTALRREEVPDAAPAATPPATPPASTPPGAAQTTKPATNLASAPSVTATTLDPVAGVAAGAIAAAEAKDTKPKNAKPDATAALPPATPPQTAAAPAKPEAKPDAKPAAKPKSGLDKPWLQIGIFSVEANARGAAAALKSSGMVPVVRQQESQGKPFWRVVVGPASSASERDTLLKQIKAAGFTDAYATTN